MHQYFSKCKQKHDPREFKLYSISVNHNLILPLSEISQAHNILEVQAMPCASGSNVSTLFKSENYKIDPITMNKVLPEQRLTLKGTAM